MLYSNYLNRPYIDRVSTVYRPCIVRGEREGMGIFTCLKYKLYLLNTNFISSEKA